METLLFLIIINNKKYYSKCVFNKDNMSIIKMENSNENIYEYYCSLWMKKLIEEEISVSYIGQLSKINQNHKFDIIIDESKSNYVYIKKKLKLENFVPNFINSYDIEKKSFTYEDIYKTIFDKFKTLWNENLEKYMEDELVIDLIIWKYKKILKSKKQKPNISKYSNEYDFELTNDKVDRESGKSLTDKPKEKYNYNEKSYKIDVKKSWLKEELINETTDQEEIYKLCNLFSVYEYIDDCEEKDETFIIRDELKQHWSEVVKIIRIMNDFINNLDKAECVKTLYDFYTNQINKFEKIYYDLKTVDINTSYKYLLKLLTLYSWRFMVEDENYIYYDDYDNSIEIKDYNESSEREYFSKYDQDCEITTIVKIIFDNGDKLYYEDCYDFESLDGYIISKLENDDIPEILHRKYYNYILTKLNKYDRFY